jgi:hypothetical protein
MQSLYIDDIRVTRVIVSLEHDAGSNIYSQIELTKEQFVKVTKLIESFMEHTEDGGFLVTCTDDEYSLPDNLRNSYERP